jgi:hypothetical protein
MRKVECAAPPAPGPPSPQPPPPPRATCHVPPTPAPPYYTTSHTPNGIGIGTAGGSNTTTNRASCNLAYSNPNLHTTAQCWVMGDGAAAAQRPTAHCPQATSPRNSRWRLASSWEQLQEGGGRGGRSEGDVPDEEE